MDEREEFKGGRTTAQSRLHNRWSLLVLGLDYVTSVAELTAEALATATRMAAQHAIQLNVDHEFAELIEIEGAE